MTLVRDEEDDLRHAPNAAQGNVRHKGCGRRRCEGSGASSCDANKNIRAAIRRAMRLLVASVPDVASLAQRDALLRPAHWADAGDFGRRAALRSGSALHTALS